MYNSSIINLKNGQKLTFSSHSENISLIFANEDEGLLLKFPLNNINQNTQNSGLYSISISKFFLKDSERRLEILEDLLEEEGITLMEGDKFKIEEYSSILKHHNCDIANLNGQKATNYTSMFNKNVNHNEILKEKFKKFSSSYLFF